MVRDIPAGEELLLAPKVPLNLRDMLYDNSDKETGRKQTIYSVFTLDEKRNFYELKQYALMNNFGMGVVKIVKMYFKINPLLGIKSKEISIFP